MANKQLSITVRGANHVWSFTFIGDTKHIPTWIEDGLDIVELINRVPVWVPPKLRKPYMFMQDIINFRWSDLPGYFMKTNKTKPAPPVGPSQE